MMAGCGASNAKEKVQSGAAQPQAGRIAVIELFTSQGCSSCPPADELVGSYSSEKNLVTLSFHVDYWDRLGWKDAFSSSEFSRRQYKYASALKTDVYTPQAVINGKEAFVASDKNKMNTAINIILSQKPVTFLTIEKATADNGKGSVVYNLKGDLSGTVANIAVVEKKTETRIGAGENMGAKLVDYNVVRSFQSTDAVHEGENQSDIHLPVNAGLKNLAIIIYLQRKNNLEITAGAKADL